MIRKGDLEFGQIVWVNFDPSIGHEYRKKRPALVVQSKEQLAKSNLITVIPLTSALNNSTADDILITANSTNHLSADSLLKVYCISSFDYSRFEKIIGKLDSHIEVLVQEYIKKHFGLI